MPLDVVEHGLRTLAEDVVGNNLHPMKRQIEVSENEGAMRRQSRALSMTMNTLGLRVFRRP